MKLLFSIGIFSAIAGGGVASGGLVSRYTFDETTGTTAVDSGPAGANGVIGSNVTLGVAGRFGTAFTFKNDAAQKGIVDMGNAATFSALNASQQVTISVWIKWTSSSDNRDSVVFLGNDTVADRYLDVGTVGGTNSGNIGGVFGRCRNATSFPSLTNSSGLNNSQWHHIAYTADASADQTRIYIDGVLAGITNTPAFSFPAFNNFEVGRLGRGSPTDAFAGSVDELRIYDAVLSAPEIAALAGLPSADPLLGTATSLSFESDGSASVYTIPIRNGGMSQTLVLPASNAVTFSGPDAGFFSIVGNDNHLVPGASGEIQVNFDPTLPGGGGGRVYSATLSISSNDSLNPTKAVQLQVSVAQSLVDSDGDGLPDDWEIQYGLDADDDGSGNVNNGPFGDPDGDGVTNIEELRLGTSPINNQFPDARGWQARPDKANLMVISAHPDDEGIFFGGTYAYYTQVKRLHVVGISMTSGDATLAPQARESEFRDAVWTYGLRNPPIFPRFKDTRTTTLDETWDLWADGVVDGKGVAEGRQLATRTVAMWIRRYRPDVVATHDFQGEYGHMNHQATALATSDALGMAADPQVNLSNLPPWQVKKMYVHLLPSAPLFHDHWETISIDTDGNGVADASPRQVTNAGMEFHVSQGKPKVSTVYASGEVRADWGIHPSEWWGLFSSTVGPDTVVPDFTAPDPNNIPMTYSNWARGDFFENLKAFADRDGDGLPDDWELHYFADVSVADPVADSDHDGISNLDEFIMGTNPKAPDLLNLAVAPGGGSVTHVVPGATGAGYGGLVRHYRLQGSSNLVNWSPLDSGIADGLPKTHAIPAGSGSARFFRLAIELK